MAGRELSAERFLPSGRSSPIGRGGRGRRSQWHPPELRPLRFAKTGATPSPLVLPSYEEAKCLTQSEVRPFELRGRVTACVVGSVIARAQVPVGLYILCFLDRFVVVRLQPCNMRGPMLLGTLFPIECLSHALSFDLHGLLIVELRPCCFFRRRSTMIQHVTVRSAFSAPVRARHCGASAFGSEP